MPLHLDYRPKNLDEFWGNDSVKAALRTIFERKDRPRAFMFYGPSGCGKTTLARIVAQEYGCYMPTDYRELNIAQVGGKDESGRIQREMHYAPQGGPISVWCLDEIQDSSSAFQAGMLKALEDTPAHVLFILCTTDPGKLRKTIHTRCSKFEVAPLPPHEMAGFVRHVLASEGLADYPDEPIQAIVEAAEGSPRQALVILDQVIDITDYDLLMTAIKRTGPAEEASTIDLCRALLRGEWVSVSAVLNNMVETERTDNTERVRQGVLTYMRKVLLGQRPDHQAYIIIKHFERPFWDAGFAGLVAACWASVKSNSGIV